MRVKIEQDTMMLIKAGSVVEITADQAELLKGRFSWCAETAMKTAPEKRAAAKASKAAPAKRTAGK